MKNEAIVACCPVPKGTIYVGRLSAGVTSVRWPWCFYFLYLSALKKGRACCNYKQLLFNDKK